MPQSSCLEAYPLEHNSNWLIQLPACKAQHAMQPPMQLGDCRNGWVWTPPLSPCSLAEHHPKTVLKTPFRQAAGACLLTDKSAGCMWTRRCSCSLLQSAYNDLQHYAIRLPTSARQQIGTPEVLIAPRSDC